MTDVDVLVAGAGVTGLFTALKLLRNGYSVVVVDTFPLGKFASTRNQGWLLGGAMFAGDWEAASAFRSSGAEYLREFSSAVDSAIRSYYYFDDLNSCARFQEKCRAGGSFCERRPAEYVTHVEPMLAGLTGKLWVEVQDRRIDASRLLIQLAERVLRHGGVILNAGATFPNLPTRREDGSYEWNVANERLAARAVVSALGASSFLDEHLKDEAAPEVFTVLTIGLPLVSNTGRRTLGLLGRQMWSRYLDEFEKGVTVTVTGTANESRERFVAAALTALEDVFLNLPREIAGREIDCAVYQCSVRTPKKPRIILKWIHQNYCIAVPAKMSLAPYTAERCLLELRTRLAPKSPRPRWHRELELPPICTRAAVQVGRHALTSTNGTSLVFR